LRIGTAFALCVALALTSCGESLETKPLSAQALRALADVHVDPTTATATLNSYRTSHGLGSVRLDPALTTMAQHQADAMAAGNQLSHDVAGSFSSRFLASGLDAPRAAENIGGGYYSTEEAFKGWRDSPGHNANLLMPQATRFGIAIAKDGRTRFRVFWAMEVAADADPRTSGAAGLAISPSVAATPPKP
jgi:uncharacterized protein YkwD